MKKIVLFSVSLMSLAMPTVIHAADQSEKSVDVKISLRQWVKNPDGKGFSTSSMGTYQGKAYLDKDGDYEPVLKPIDGYKLINPKIDKPIRGTVKSGFTVTYVACKSDPGSSEIAKQAGQSASQSTSDQLLTLPSLTTSAGEGKGQAGDQQSKVKTMPASGSKPVSPQPPVSREQPSDNKRTNSPKDSVLQETKASQQPLPSKQSSDVTNLTNQSKGQSISDQITTHASSTSSEKSRKNQTGGQQSEIKPMTGLADKVALIQSSTSMKRPSDVKETGLSQPSALLESGISSQPLKPIQTVTKELAPTIPILKKAESQGQSELPGSHKRLADREASQPVLTKVCGVNENGEPLFEKTVDRDQLATIYRQGSEVYGYDWQRTTYDRARSCYLLQYQRKTILVTIIGVDQAGKRLESHQVFGKFGREVTCQAVPIQGYQPVIASKQISLSTPEPQTVEMLYLKNEAPKPVSTRAVDQAFSITNDVPASLSNLESKPIEPAATHHVKKSRTQLKKPKHSKHAKKSKRRAEKKKGIHQAKKVANSATTSLSKPKAGSKPATSVSKKQSSNQQTSRQLPQTGESDSKKGMIVGLGLLLGLLFPIVKKKI